MSRSPISVLLIDDEPTVRKAVTLILGRAGVRVIGSDNGVSGLALAGTLLPDLIICDAMMPGISGPELVNRLLEHPSTAAIPILLISGFPLAFDEDVALEAGDRVGFLPKPFSAKDLLDAVWRRVIPAPTAAAPLFR